jgi:hypothetical protein
MEPAPPKAWGDRGMGPRHGSRKRGTIVLSLVAFASLGVAGALSASAQESQRTTSRASASPLYFHASKNLSDSPIKYSARSTAYSLLLSNDEADVVLHGESTPSSEVTRGKLIVVQAYANLLRMHFVDSNLPTSVGPLERENGLRDYSTAIAYRGVYPGADIIIRGDQRRIRFQVNLGPGTDSDHIVLEIAGATSIQLDGDGDAIVYAGRESLTLQRPMVKLGVNSKSIPGAYRIESGNRLRFIIDAPASENNQTITD